jgi:hypothetical protein
MSLAQDSISTHVGVGVQGDTVAPKHTTITPAMVLSWLPRSATPAQQDSAIQAHFKPAEIRWSQRPDTLHLPGHNKGKNLLDIQLPQYYREGFFSKDSLFHPELPGGRYGLSGDPIPYTVHNDNVITSLLLACFLLSLMALASARHFMARQAKRFFFLPNVGTTELTETVKEVRLQMFMAFLSSLLISILFYFYTVNYLGDTFILKSQYYLIAIYLVMIVGYFLLKILLYTVVNSVFFGSKKNKQWIKSMLFIMSIEGLLLFPIVLLVAYYNFSVRNAAICFVIVLIIVKLLTFYKCFVIFFRQNVLSLQIFLYFCALEIVPLLSSWGTLVFVANSLKINF